MRYVIGVENNKGLLLKVWKDIDAKELKEKILKIGEYVKSGDLESPNIIIQTYKGQILPGLYEEQLQFNYDEALKYVTKR